ncbi:DNA-protecting protein DprA [Candidatus Microgenomates bacterium]|nr:DNA-protecting protein DprA [Candidatus Microgenomates bacterium]
MTEKQYLVALAAFITFGPARIKLLLEYFGKASKVWQAPRVKLLELGLKEKYVASFDEFRNKFNNEQYFNQLKQQKIEVLTINDKLYPARLSQIDDAPMALYIKGEFKQEDEVCIAVVGSRKITNYGREAAYKLSSELAASGVTIISGLALGVDGVAHQAALDVRGRTLAVVGTGLDQVYPPIHKKLADNIIKSGAIISEYPLGYPALPANFPYRNRIISGMSLGVLVIEGTEKSGTLLTAAHAAAQGRDVFAVPGPITSINSAAPHILLKNGAKLVSKAQDILEELKVGQRTRNIANRKILLETEEEKLLINLLENEPLHIDEILRNVEMANGLVLSTLTTMELKGIVKNIGGNIYQLIEML